MGEATSRDSPSMSFDLRCIARWDVAAVSRWLESLEPPVPAHPSLRGGTVASAFMAAGVNGEALLRLVEATSLSSSSLSISSSSRTDLKQQQKRVVSPTVSDIEIATGIHCLPRYIRARIVDEINALSEVGRREVVASARPSPSMIEYGSG